MSKIIDHPVVKLKKQVHDLEKKVKDLEVDLAVLKDLLIRTIRIVKKLDAQNQLKSKPNIVKKPQ